jgi:two-component system, chemotaxis family, protein-glutamate methylesterase/glutaminase
MPREAVALNAVSEIVDLEQIAAALLKNIVGQARRI